MTIRFRPQERDGIVVPNTLVTDLPFVGKYLEVPHNGPDGRRKVLFERVQRRSKVDGTTFIWWDVALVWGLGKMVPGPYEDIEVVSRFEREIVL